MLSVASGRGVANREVVRNRGMREIGHVLRHQCPDGMHETRGDELKE